MNVTMGSVEQLLQSILGISLCLLGFTTWLIAQRTKGMSTIRRAMWICVGNLFLMQGLYRTVEGGLLNLGVGAQYWLWGGCLLSLLAILILATREQKQGGEIIAGEKIRVPLA